MTNKQLQKQNLDELMKKTLLNILSAKGIIYTYYKNKKLTKGNYEKTKSLYEQIDFKPIPQEIMDQCNNEWEGE